MIPKRWLVLISILLLAFVLRLFALNTRPLWYDEVFSVFIAEQDLPRIASGTAADTMAPLYCTLLHFWLPMVGETAFAMRMLSVAFSMLVVAVVYVVGNHGVSRAVGEWSAFFAAMAPFQIYYGQELRMYSLLAFSLLVFLYALMRLEKGLHNAVILIAISTALAIFSHNLAFLTLIAADVYLAWRHAWEALRSLLIGQGIGVAVALPWLLYLPGQVQGIQRAFWTQPPGVVDILQMLTMFTTHLPLPPAALGGALFVTLAILALTILALERNVARDSAGAVTLWLVFAVVPPLLMFLVSYVVNPVFIPRGVIASSLAYYLLLGVIAARAARPVRIGILTTACMIALVTLPFLYSGWGEWRRSPFVEADQFLREHARQDELILHDNKLSFFPMHLYDRTLPQQYLSDPPGSGNDTLASASREAMGLFPVDFDAAIRGHAPIWFVIFQTALDQATEEGHPHGNLSRLDANLRRGQVVSFGDLRVFEYEAR